MHYAPNRNPDTTPANEDSTFWREILYRWFVQYNPAYLLSAAFVLAGCCLWAKGASRLFDLTSTLGIPLLAEIYALSLVGGAALLTRIGQRRAAVMLGLIFVVYQWDTTLHTEACTCLGWVGIWASLAWLGIFIAKLFLIGWALRIRIGRRMLAAGILGALGLVIAPHAFMRLGAYEGGSIMAGWIFGLISLYDGASISSTVPLDAWGQTVLRRATSAAWVISGSLITLHVVMWTGNYAISLAPTILGLPLLAIPRLRTETNVWLVAFSTSIFTLLVAPSAFAVIAILASGALCLRIVAPKISPVAVYATPHEAQPAPYRAGRPIRNTLENEPIQLIAFELTIGERLRCWSGALFSAYLGLWAMSWVHGAPGHHVLTLDVALTLMAGVAAWRTRAHANFLVPLTLTYVHLVAQARLIPIPTSDAGIGKAAIAFGFALLGGALLVSYKLRGSEAAKSQPREAGS
jgi:hypothetical protein